MGREKASEFKYPYIFNPDYIYECGLYPWWVMPKIKNEENYH